MTKLKLLTFMYMFVLLSCQGNPGGNAPSQGGDAPTSPPNLPSYDQSQLKFGETVSSTNGWEVSLDTSDSVETIQLANGWTVEVLND